MHFRYFSPQSYIFSGFCYKRISMHFRYFSPQSYIFSPQLYVSTQSYILSPQSYIVLPFGFCVRHYNNHTHHYNHHTHHYNHHTHQQPCIFSGFCYKRISMHFCYFSPQSYIVLPFGFRIRCISMHVDFALQRPCTILESVL